MSKPIINDDLKRPGDTGRKPPAIPLNKREDFLADVKAIEEGSIDRSELAKRWKRYIALDQPRTLYDWQRWAREVIAARAAPKQDNGEGEG